MELDEIRALIELMKENDLSVFKMEKEGIKITLKKTGAEQILVDTSPLPAPPGPVQEAAVAPAPEPADENVPDGKQIKSPMVGTFYRAPSPESEPYVNEGDEIAPGKVVCIIEAMKVMNEIKAEVSGVIAEICAENGKPVEFGEPLFRLK